MISDLLPMVGNILDTYMYTVCMRMNIFVKLMWCVQGIRVILMSNAIKRTGPVLYNQQVTADQRITQKRGESKRYVKADMLVKVIYHCTLILSNKDCVSMYMYVRQVN